ncbi:O-antigen/teichoic acid export membrane protein [Thermolongibacillus altinsuensis]|uniref:O-antigen/teichoic acid export membrane protein n=1 Tax=Thermolongibacillus altinsuensis TaxID=575256 RepID=A0A4R1QHA4_9BACL|nr:oligosaccharide flippase family protein [Thermolongibacillus altinsuensis]TCL52826.1 O-antigen/teichoic acid export membrane protein [Thermolongibacillus altinsuensis]
MLRHIINYIPAKIVPGMVNFLALAIYARILTDAEYGRYSIVIASTSMVQTIFFAWIRMGLERYLQHYKTKGQLEIFLTNVRINFILVSIIVSVLWLTIVSMLPLSLELKESLFIGLPLAIIQSYYEQTLSTYRAELNSKRYSYLSIFRSLLIFPFSLFFIYILRFNEQGILLGIILGNLFPLLISVLVGQKYKLNLSCIDMGINRNLLYYGAPLTITFLLSFIISTSDRFIIQYILGVEAVGIYSIAYDLVTQVLTMIFMIINLAAYPIIIKEIESKPLSEVKERINQYGLISFGVMFPSVTGFIMLSPFIAELILGDTSNNEVKVSILKWIAFSTLIMGIKSYFVDFSYQLGKKTYLQIWSSLVAALSNIILNFLLIPKYKVMGAVYATVFSYILGLIISIVIGQKVFSLKIDIKEITKIIFASVILIFSLYITPFDSVNLLNFVINILIGILAYSVVVIYLNIGNIRGIFNRDIFNFIKNN